MTDQTVKTAALRAVGAVLSDMSGEIDCLGAQLCADPAVVERHLTELQAIDLISQKLSALAQIMAAECPHTAVGQIQLEALSEHFTELACNCAVPD